ncbi:hypothetical protein CBS63078_5529 [Aspergillus niger]|nr:hypothetical protein CBS12448_2709 [Aspergillus niger]KAI2900578.1 hypothetical protein CBS13152_2169 [Aspergillus niger]KAI2904959.1 hypothetical protein CBS63078_5529 [Aspergillus niger]KAI2914222.1 hypothetical protein CBS147371_6522 [Aspergillus niger]KAI2929739.1 hypothetical protein CBS147320_3700 [Aspergillus niger]
MTDPNFLHAGDHVHLGPGVSSTRRTNPAVDLEELPRIDLVLLSHYHGDHFDRKVEASLRRDLPIVTTPHAKSILTSKGDDSFTRVSSVDVYEQLTVDIKPDQNDAQRQQRPKLRITGMPGKHIPVGKPLEKLNELVGAIPPTNGWMLELGYGDANSFTSGYRIYISGDTLMFDDLKEIPRRYAGQPIDLMLVHLGGTTVPSPAMLPLAMMVTMDAKQGVELIKLIRPQVTIPIHYDDYDVFATLLYEAGNPQKERKKETKMSHSHNNYHPVASADKVPTIHTIQPMKRSTSYSPTQESDEEYKQHVKKDSASSTVACGNDHKVKAALTELLNDDGVKCNARGSRSVQNLLMDTEKALRKQRRESLSGRASISVAK